MKRNYLDNYISPFRGNLLSLHMKAGHVAECEDCVEVKPLGFLKIAL